MTYLGQKKHTYSSKEKKTNQDAEYFCFGDPIQFVHINPLQSFFFSYEFRAYPTAFSHAAATN